MVIVRMPERFKPFFNRYVGIDYSGAEPPDSSLKGLRVYEVTREFLPVEVEPPLSPRKFWTLRGLTEWLAEHLTEDVPNYRRAYHLTTLSDLWGPPLLSLGALKNHPVRVDSAH